MRGQVRGGEVLGGLSEGGNRDNEADYCGWGIVAPNIKRERV